MRLYCDAINDPYLERAVIYAIELIREGYFPSVANAQAARAFGYDTRDVSQYTGQHAARIRAMRKQRGGR
jgi:hypothetical protein